MGLFDKILKGAVDAIDNAAAKSGNGPTGLKDLFNQAMGKKDEAINGTSSSTASSKPSTATSNTSSSKRSNCAYTRPTYTTPQEVLDTASIPAKPSREITYEIFDGKDAEIRVKVSFDLSGDFIETECEFDYGAMYLPNCDDDFDDNYSDSNTPYFEMVSAPDDEIYYMIDKCRNGGTPDNAMMFLRVDDMGSRIQFKAKVKNRFGKIEYFYNCQFHDEFNPQSYIGVCYNADVVGTPLEKKLMAAVDEAARTFRREVVKIEDRPFR